MPTRLAPSLFALALAPSLVLAPAGAQATPPPDWPAPWRCPPSASTAPR